MVPDIFSSLACTVVELAAENVESPKSPMFKEDRPRSMGDRPVSETLRGFHGLVSGTREPLLGNCGHFLTTCLSSESHRQELDGHFRLLFEPCLQTANHD